MGCKTSNLKDISLQQWKLGIKRQPLQELQISYHTDHDKFDLVMLDSEIQKNFINEKQNLEFIKFFEMFYGKYKSRFDKFKIPYNNLKKIVLEKIVETQIKDQFQYKVWNIKSFIFNLLEDQKELTEEKEESFKHFFSTTVRYFPIKQKGCIIIGKDFEKVQEWGLKNYLSNLKFNASFENEFLVIYLTPFILENEENIFDLCEVIESNKNLNSVALIVKIFENNIDQISNPENEKFPMNLHSISYLIKTIQVHPNINSFAFANYSSYKYSLPQVTVDSLFNLINIDKLNSIVISKIYFSDLIIQRIFKSFGNLKNLKFLLLDSEMMNPENLLEDIKNTLIKIKNLNGVLLAGIQDNKVNENNYNKKLSRDNIVNEVKAKNKNLKFFEIFNDIHLME